MAASTNPRDRTFETPAGTAPARSRTREIQFRRRRLAAVLILVIVIALVWFAIASIANAMSVSQRDEAREVTLDGAGAVLTVPAEWILEQPAFSDDLTIYTPDGAVAMCFDNSSDEGTAAALVERLAAEREWLGTYATTERSPTGNEVVHQTRPESAAPETDCGDLPIAMLAALDTGDVPPSEIDTQSFIAVRIATEGDVTPYLGEIATVLEGVKSE